MTKKTMGIKKSSLLVLFLMWASLICQTWSCCGKNVLRVTPGSCWAFSSTGAMEGVNALYTAKFVILSEQELVDCVTAKSGCGGGWMNNAFQSVKNNWWYRFGIPLSLHSPRWDTQYYREAAMKDAAIHGFANVDRSESALFCAVFDQPVSVAVDASAADFQLYTGGIHDGSCSSDPSRIDHAVLVVGYGSSNGKDCWIVKNSWGQNWSVKGYIYRRRNTVTPYSICAIGAWASYPTKNAGQPRNKFAAMG